MSSLESRKVKQGTSWRVVYYWEGRKDHVKIGITTRRIAQQRQSQIDAHLAMGQNPKEAIRRSTAVTLTQLLEKDSEWCSSRMRSQSRNITAWAMGHLKGWADDILISQVNRDLIERFLVHLRDSKGCNDTTINMQLRSLKAVFQRAVSEYGYLKEHPFRSVKSFTENRRTKKVNFLTEDQIHLLLNGILDPHFKQLVRFYLLTGCRRTEALELRWDEIDRQNEILYLGQPDSQTKLRRSFPLSESLVRLLEELDSDREGKDNVFWRYSLNPSYVSKRFQEIRERVEGLPSELTPHLLRHTFASHLVMHGVDLTTVASLMGHSTAKVTELYAHLQPDHKKSAVEKLAFKLWG